MDKTIKLNLRSGWHTFLDTLLILSSIASLISAMMAQNGDKNAFAYLAVSLSLVLFSYLFSFWLKKHYYLCFEQRALMLQPGLFQEDEPVVIAKFKDIHGVTVDYRHSMRRRDWVYFAVIFLCDGSVYKLTSGFKAGIDHETALEKANQEAENLAAKINAIFYPGAVRTRVSLVFDASNGRFTRR
ncbi:MAG: hypothetical protein PWR01_3669 [Clostridiales bacterium]|nr:hypothetical protein [Clostridiales bacterium]MDN5282596.1 hypothetical protein [Candidatus Ozemobacter sp.]